MLGYSGESTGIAANAGLMAAAQVLVQQQQFEAQMNERAERERAEEAAEREELRRAAAERVQEAAVVVDLSKTAPEQEPQADTSRSGGSEPQQAAGNEHNVDISA